MLGIIGETYFLPLMIQSAATTAQLWPGAVAGFRFLPLLSPPLSKQLEGVIVHTSPVYHVDRWSLSGISPKKMGGL